MSFAVGLYQSSLQGMRRKHEIGNRLTQFISRRSLTSKEGTTGWELDSVPLSLHVLRLLHPYQPVYRLTLKPPSRNGLEDFSPFLLVRGTLSFHILPLEKGQQP